MSVGKDSFADTTNSRSRWAGVDVVDRWRFAIAAVAIVALVATVAYLSTKDFVSKPMNLNGDSLGQESGQSLDDYKQFADTTLEEASGTRWALVSFNPVVPRDDVGRILDAPDFTVTRVAAAIPTEAKPFALPEPTAGASRAQVVAQQERNNNVDSAISGVVVYSDAQSLREAAQVAGVFAVEVAPDGAAWGRFGIRQVVVQPGQSG